MKRDADRNQLIERRRIAAQKYKPNLIRLLLVAEAPPAADDRYFYFEDVKSHDGLFFYVTYVLFGQKPDRSNKAIFLTRLKDSGVFLIDLKLDPIDGTDLDSYVPDLVSRCRLLNPQRIILIKATVFDAAYQTMLDSDLPVIHKRIYAPSTGRQLDFCKQFKEALSMKVEG